MFGDIWYDSLNIYLYKLLYLHTYVSLIKSHKISQMAIK